MKNDEPDGRIAKVCVPCQAGMPPMSHAEILSLLLPDAKGWMLSEDGLSLKRDLRLRDFAQVMRVLNAVAEVAERENHHPSFFVDHYRDLSFTLRTHAAKGITMNDFVLARAIDEIVANTP